MRDDPLLTLRFSGSLLNDRSMPIYELGEIFIAMQRIVHKAYLHSEKRYEPGTRLRPDVRRELALRVGRQKRGSDVYEIYRFLTSPDGLDIARNLVPMALYGLGAYAAGRAVAKKQVKPTVHQTFVTSIYPEVNIFTDRIGNVGEVTNIELRSSLGKEAVEVNIDADTQEYVRSLASETYLGELVYLDGVVTRLNPLQLSIELQTGPRQYVRVRMDERLFGDVRYSRKGDRVKIKANAIIRFGQESRRISEYQATEILEIGSEKDWFD
jgi:hypothetical protein